MRGRRGMGVLVKSKGSVRGTETGVALAFRNPVFVVGTVRTDEQNVLRRQRGFEARSGTRMSAGGHGELDGREGRLAGGDIQP